MTQLADVASPEVIALGIVAVVYGGPILHILLSRRSRGGAKFGWFLAEMFVPIVVYIIFLIATQRTADALKLEEHS